MSIYIVNPLKKEKNAIATVATAASAVDATVKSTREISVLLSTSTNNLCSSVTKWDGEKGNMLDMRENADKKQTHNHTDERDGKE